MIPNNFHLLKYMPCPTTGVVGVAIGTVTSRGKIIERKGSFLAHQDAVQWIHKQLQEYLMMQLIKFVTHKKILMKTSDRAFYRTAKKLIELQEIERKIDYMKEFKTVHPICAHIINMRPALEYILPMSSNRSYEESKNKLLHLYHLALRCKNNQLIVKTVPQKLKQTI